MDGRVTKRLSQEFSRKENRFLGAVARLDNFLMNQLVSHETSRNLFSTIQGTNEDDFKSDLHPEVGPYQRQTTQNSGPKDGRDSDLKF